VSEQPWSFAEAVERCRSTSIAQENLEASLQDAYKDYAQKEEAYRKALAGEIVKQHLNGVAWSTAPDIARGNSEVARLRMERDVSEGVKEALTQAAWRANANRKDAQRFADWSQRRELAEFHGREPAEQFGAQT
jgi:hypothetical protein